MTTTIIFIYSCNIAFLMEATILFKIISGWFRGMTPWDTDALGNFPDANSFLRLCRWLQCMESWTSKSVVSYGGRRHASSWQLTFTRRYKCHIRFNAFVLWAPTGESDARYLERITCEARHRLNTETAKQLNTSPLNKQFSWRAKKMHCHKLPAT